MKRAYCRCNGGDYFVGRVCPLDGWSSPASHELADAVERLDATGTAVSTEELRRLGVSEVTLERTIVIDFASDAAVFELIHPEGYIVDGQWKLLHQLGREFM